MKTVRRLGARWLIALMSVLIGGTGTLSAQPDEPGPFERFFRSMRRAFNEPQHKSSAHRSKPRQTQDTGNPAATTDESPSPVSSTGSNSSSVSKPPNEKNTRGTSKAVTKKGEDLPYGTPVAGKKGFVTSPFSPNSGYIDVGDLRPEHR